MKEEKIEELIEKNISREEAKKLLKNEDMLEEFDQMLQLKAVLSDMKVSTPAGLEKRILVRKRKSRARRFAFAFTSVFVAVAVFIFAVHNVIPLQLNAPTMHKGAAPEQNTLMSPAVSAVPEIKVVLNRGVNKADVENTLNEYCKWEGKDLCAIKKERINDLITALKKYGEVQTKGIEKDTSMRSPEGAEKEVKIKIQLITK